MIAKKVEPHKLPDNTPDDIKDLLINDLFVFGRCVYNELSDGTIERVHPLTEIPENK